MEWKQAISFPRKSLRSFTSLLHYINSVVAAVLVLLAWRGILALSWHVSNHGSWSHAPRFYSRLGSRCRVPFWPTIPAAGIDGNFSSHSFCIGAATVAARNGVPDHLIEALGRWTSNAYQLYIKTPAALAGFSSSLAWWWLLFQTVLHLSVLPL